MPEGIDVEKFKKAIRLGENTPHRYNPEIPAEWEEFFKGKKLLDPFAGFGSIPLEALRLGLSATAVDLIPTAYIFLKAVLEYPRKYGKELVRDVERWGNWITERLKADEELKELYDEDVAVYIGTWEIRCPWCGRWTPAIGNFWLARVKDARGRYTWLAYMKPKLKRDEIEIEVVDLNELHKDVSGARVDTRGGKISIDGKTYEVPEANIASRRSQLTCLACGNLIRFADENGEHYTESRREQNNEFYVKFALKKYHEGDERFARQRLLVKVKVARRDLIFEPATKEDSEKLWKAKEKVKELLERKDPDVPTEQIPLYENRRITPILGVEKWYQLFNPRQLLTLIKIERLIHEVGKKVEEEKLSEGWDKEKAFEFAEAVATYLSVTMVNQMRHNCIVTSVEPTRKFVAHALASRGIAITWNWIEEIPWRYFIGTWLRSLEIVKNSMYYLATALDLPTQKTTPLKSSKATPPLSTLVKSLMSSLPTRRMLMMFPTRN